MKVLAKKKNYYKEKGIWEMLEGKFTFTIVENEGSPPIEE